MNYLLDKKNKRKKLLIFGIIAVILGILIYFNSVIFSGFSFASHTVFRPILVAGNNLSERFQNMSSFFSSKRSLSEENENLRLQLNEFSSRISNYNSILNENTQMKEILERRIGDKKIILGTILAKPNQSLYDTLIIDIGDREEIKQGSLVFAFGNTPIGRVAEVYSYSSKVLLFSSPGEVTEVIIGEDNLFMDIVGRGGGNFEINIPRNIVLQSGDEVVLPGINSYVIAKVETIISDPRDSFQKALLVSPINLQELKFVEVEK